MTTEKTILIGLMLEKAADKIISVLVKRGYAVQAASNKGNVCNSEQDNMCTVLALSITKNIDCKNAFNDVKDVLDITSTKYYMLVITEGYAALRWNVGNVIIKDLDIPKQGPYRSGNLN